MKAGVVYPQTELMGDSGAVKAFAQAAEGLGYDHLILYDHVLGADHSDRNPKLTGTRTATSPGRIISRMDARVEMATHFPYSAFPSAA